MNFTRFGKKLITSILFFSITSKCLFHSPKTFIIFTLKSFLENLLKARAEFKHDFTVPTLLINGDQ